MKVNPEMKVLAKQLISREVLKTKSLYDAFIANDRKDFVPIMYQEYAYENMPLSIGFGQTISQPYTVAFMLELLQPKLGDEILDIGFGSGWTTGILAKTVGNEGSVFAVEIIPEVYKFGKVNLEKYNYPNIELFLGSWLDLPERKFDCILASAATHNYIVDILIKKLKVGGRLVIPVKNTSGQSIRLVIKNDEFDIQEQNHPGFIFVPLV
ncbi:MAG: protein-L-isoaspartate O-methyltransferase [Paludibacter sp.]